MKPENSLSNPSSGYVIGFSGTYYCLWYWCTESNYSMSGSGQYVATDSYTKYHYIKRISTDLNKVKELYPNVSIDMGLHGQRWQRNDNTIKREILADDVFPYGFRGVGDKIIECNEIKFLWSLYLSVQTGIGRSKVYARRRLAELGLIVPYKTSRTIDVMRYDYELCKEVPTGEIITIRSSYSSPKYVAKLESAKEFVRGNFFENGKRIELSVKEIKSFSFETQYGICYVVEYIDADNRVFKYKGSTPPSISKDEFETIQATIKHSVYKGQEETTIQRVKVLSLN